MLVNDSHGSFLGPNLNALNVVTGFAQRLQFRMDDVGCFNGGLRVEFRRIGYLEQNILHNVGCIW